MQQLLGNRYFRMATLTARVALILSLFLWLLFSLLGWRDFPALLVVGLAVLGAGLIVYRYISHKLF